MEKTFTKYDFFISHKKSEATASARYLKLLLIYYKSKLKIFYDSDDLIDLNDLYQYINHTKTIIILLTKKYFRSFWCFFEFMVFTMLQKKIICFMFPDSKNYLDSWITNIKSSKLIKRYNSFTPYQKEYIKKQLKDDISDDFFDNMCDSIKNMQIIKIKELSSTTSNINIFRNTVLKTMRKHLSITLDSSVIKKSDPSCKALQDSSNNIILVGYLHHEIVSIAKIIRFLFKESKIGTCLFFKDTDSIRLSNCNTVAIVLLYDNCLENTEFVNNLLSLNKFSDETNKIIFQGIQVDNKFKYLEIEEIEDIVDQLSFNDDDKQILTDIYIMLIKQYISIPFDSYQSLDILKTQLSLIIKRLIYFLPNCYNSTVTST
jgi:hypothetical protein